MKVNKIKGGVYKGTYWADVTSASKAKKIAHKEERQRAKRDIAKALA